MRYLACLFVLLLLPGCGVLLGERYVRQEERFVAKTAGLSEPAHVAYASASTAAFDPAAIAATVHVRITGTRFCRRYAESVHELASAEGRSVAVPGLLVDGALFAGTAVAAVLFIANPGALAVAAAAGAIPLGADLVVRSQVAWSAPATMTTRAPDPGPGTDQAGLYPCEVTAVTGAPLVWNGAEIEAGGDGVYRIRLDEAALAALGTPSGVVFTPTLRPGAGAAATVPVEARLGAAYASFAVTRDTVRRFPTPSRVARFVTGYPASQAAAEMRGYLLTMMPAFNDAAELREAAGVPGLDPELRRALRERFNSVHLAEIRGRVPALLRTALDAERNANTFLLNGFEAEGKRLLAEKEAAIAEACRLQSEYATRSGDQAELAQALARKLAEAERRAAGRWLESCP